VVFGRRKGKAAEAAGAEEFVDDLSPEERAAEDAEIERELAEQDAAARKAGGLHPQGPWDLADADEPTDAPRLDLGALRVLVHPGVDVRLELNEESQVVAVTLVHGESTAQINVFAAPRSEGIWDEVRTEIAESLRTGGGQATDAEGVLGTELRAAVPAQAPGQGVVLNPARFVGVDGPRWFLRALLTGPAATEDAAAAPLLAMLRDVVVVRGDEPMPAREMLGLHLPPEVAPPQPPVEPEPERAPTLQLPQRGPEITEIR
jgi:hypothetical protein